MSEDQTEGAGEESNTVMLKLGYKASADQFAPRELLEFAVHAEMVDFDTIMMSNLF